MIPNFNDTEYLGLLNNLELNDSVTWLYNGKLFVIVKTNPSTFDLFNVACAGENTIYNFNYLGSDEGVTLTAVSCSTETDFESDIEEIEDQQGGNIVINYAGPASTWNVPAFSLEI